LGNDYENDLLEKQNRLYRLQQYWLVVAERFAIVIFGKKGEFCSAFGIANGYAAKQGDMLNLPSSPHSYGYVIGFLTCH